MARFYQTSLPHHVSQRPTQLSPEGITPSYCGVSVRLWTTHPYMHSRHVQGHFQYEEELGLQLWSPGLPPFFKRRAAWRPWLKHPKSSLEFSEVICFEWRPLLKIWMGPKARACELRPSGAKRSKVVRTLGYIFQGPLTLELPLSSQTPSGW